MFRTEDVPDGTTGFGVRIINIVDSASTFAVREEANGGANLSVEDPGVESSECRVFVPLARLGATECNFNLEILN